MCEESEQKQREDENVLTKLDILKKVMTVEFFKKFHDEELKDIREWITKMIVKNSRSDIITECLWAAHDKETVLSIFDKPEQDRLLRILEKKDRISLRSSVTKFLENFHKENKMDHPDPKINVSCFFFLEF